MSRCAFVAYWLFVFAVIELETELADTDHDAYYDDDGERVLGDPAQRVVVEREEIDNFDLPFEDVTVGGGDGEGF